MGLRWCCKLHTALLDSYKLFPIVVMEVIRHAELIVEWFLWTIEHTNRSLEIQCNAVRPSQASSGIQALYA